MKIYNIKDMINGWFIGDFIPSIIRTDQFEIAHHFEKAGIKCQAHRHTRSTEINYIIDGEAKVNDNFLGSGYIFVYEKDEISDVTFLRDTNLIIIRIPSINDKEFINE
jgi:hypothetical protein